MSHVSQNFYHMMLGLPAEVGAPDHYELLGITRFEDDVERIRTAAIDRNRQLLSWQNSRFHADADRLIGEVVTSREILLDPQQKSDYDQRIGRPTAVPPVTTPAPQSPRPAAAPAVVQLAPIPDAAGAKSITATGTSPTLAEPANTTLPGWEWLTRPVRWVGIDRRLRLAGGAALLSALLIGSWLLLGGDPSAGPPAALVVPFTYSEARSAQRAWARELGNNSPLRRNSIGMELVLLPPGRFEMRGLGQDKVRLTQPFYVSKTEVTQRQWQAAMNTTPWKGQQFIVEEGDSPATYVSWDDAQEFCRTLGQKEGTTYRLLTGAEWEYACSAGTTAEYHFGDDGSELGTYAWFLDNTVWAKKGHPQEVGQKRANAFGLHDMHGNVHEWCEDWHGRNTPSFARTPQRMYRGGAFNTDEYLCKTANYPVVARSTRSYNLGFRVVEVTSYTAPPEVPAPAAMLASQRELPALLVSPFTAEEAQAAQRAWAIALEKTSHIERSSIGLELVLIPPGKFMMGSPASDSDARIEEKPQVEVILTRPLYVGRTEVTQGQWQAVMNTTPWKGQSGVKDAVNCPAVNMSWDDAQEFCRRLSAAERVPYRLLTEAEWEYACRAGTTTKYHWGDSEAVLGNFAWFADNTSKVGEEYAHEVGKKQANPFGLHDFHGNVWEWCADWHGGDLPRGTNPAGASSGWLRVRRGGCWYDSAAYCRSAGRTRDTPSDRYFRLGFRVAAVPSGL